MTIVSGRFSHERISAVEMLRGPDHTASRATSSPMRDLAVDRLAVEPGQPIGHGPLAGTDVAPVDRPHGHQSGERAGDERLVGAVDVGQAEVALAGLDPGLP